MHCLRGAQFLTQPFVVGERVTLMSGGSKVVTGKVESIDPLNTVIRDDDGVPITIPNTVRTREGFVACLRPSTCPMQSCAAFMMGP